MPTSTKYIPERSLHPFPQLEARKSPKPLPKSRVAVSLPRIRKPNSLRRDPFTGRPRSPGWDSQRSSKRASSLPARGARNGLLSHNYVAFKPKTPVKEAEVPVEEHVKLLPGEVFVDELAESLFRLATVQVAEATPAGEAPVVSSQKLRDIVDGVVEPVAWEVEEHYGLTLTQEMDRRRVLRRRVARAIRAAEEKKETCQRERHKGERKEGVELVQQYRRRKHVSERRSRHRLLQLQPNAFRAVELTWLLLDQDTAVDQLQHALPPIEFYQEVLWVEEDEEKVEAMRPIVPVPKFMEEERRRPPMYLGDPDGPALSNCV